MSAHLPLPPESTGLREPRGRLVAVLVVGVLALSAGTAWALTRSTGVAGPPAAVRAVASICPRTCRTISPRVTVVWEPPDSGAPVTGYRVLKDGSIVVAASNLDPTTRSFTDRNISLGDQHVYQVVALGEAGDSPPSTPSVATQPSPQLTVSQLDGIYQVRLTVDRARALGEFLNIEDPVPGRRGEDVWTFDSTCSGARTGCASLWEGQPGRIQPHGVTWTGTVWGPPARCGSTRTVRAPIRFELRVLTASVDDSRWAARSFRGRVSVSFRCPGFPPSAGTIDVVGIRA